MNDQTDQSCQPIATDRPSAASPDEPETEAADRAADELPLLRVEWGEDGLPLDIRLSFRDD